LLPGFHSVDFIILSFFFFFSSFWVPNSLSSLSRRNCRKSKNFGFWWHQSAHISDWSLDATRYVTVTVSMILLEILISSLLLNFHFHPDILTYFRLAREFVVKRVFSLLRKIKRKNLLSDEKIKNMRIKQSGMLFF